MGFFNSLLTSVSSTVLMVGTFGAITSAAQSNMPAMQTFGVSAAAATVLLVLCIISNFMHNARRRKEAKLEAIAAETIENITAKLGN